MSLADNPSALVTRRFGEISEMRSIFADAVASVRNADKLRPTQLKARINSAVWRIIKSGKSEEAVRVRTALSELGFENVEGSGFVMRTGPVEQFAASAVADSLPAETTATEGRGWRSLGSKVQVAAIVGQVLTDLNEGRPGAAATTAGVGAASYQVLSKFPELVPLAVTASTIHAYNDRVQEHADAFGEWVAPHHPVIGGVAAAAEATGESVLRGAIIAPAKSIKSGAHVVWVRLTSDEYTLLPWRAAWWPW